VVPPFRGHNSPALVALNTSTAREVTYQGNYKQHEENEEYQFRYPCRCNRYAGEAQNSRDERHHQEYYRPVKHELLLN
jgi:hypothetical protein